MNIEITNDFSIVVATVNGTGSQTANMALLRACFKMGIPVNAKNIFPSNIQGMPTWYHIRVSGDGYAARRETSEILAAFNQATFLSDVANLPPGGVCFYNADWGIAPQREDITAYAIPVKQFTAVGGLKGKLNDYIANMVYVGAMAQLLNIPLTRIEEALTTHFKRKQKAIAPNMAAARAAWEWTAVNHQKSDPYRVAPLDKTDGKILITGNEAAALGAVFGGVTFVAWYPITPSTSIVDGLNAHLPRLRRDPQSGKATYVVVQAEDELAAIGMILGAGWAGARAMTATSGPGISLMAEFAGLGYFAEISAVIWDVQRVGPSTGLPTKTGQGDILSTYYLGHGDTQNVLLLPASVSECFTFGAIAFDLADELQTPVFVMSDLDLGMNTWMSDPFTYPEKPIKRGKILTADEVKAGYGRYKDTDGDSVPHRTIPGNENPLAAWFARGTGHNEMAVYSERPSDWSQNMERLARKFNKAREMLPAPIVDSVDGASVGIIAYGTTEYAIEEARDRMGDDAPGFLRLRALPINQTVHQFVAEHEIVYVIELNRDGQMHKILQTEMPAMAAKLRSIPLSDGMPLTARWVEEKIVNCEL